MKYLFKVSTFALLLCGAMISCQQDEVVNETVDSIDSNSVKLVKIIGDGEVIPATRTSGEINGNYALKFASERVYQETVAKLKQMNESERLAFASSLGLISLQNLLSIADDELDEIDSLATSVLDFNAKYEKYRNKYGKYFVFNDINVEDASPYIPEGDKWASYLVGINHSMVIGEKVIEIEYSNQMSEIDETLFITTAQQPLENKQCTRAIATKPEKEWEVNDFVDRYHADHNDYKVSFKIYKSNEGKVNVRLASQKKGAFAWKRPKNQVFYLKVELNNFTYGVPGPMKVPPIITYSAKGGKTEFEFGRFTGNQITGKAYVWTEHTVEKDNLGVIHEYVNGELVPKCLISKAHACVVNLSRY